ncbi:type II toxin-antitoxin system RelE/ParE family toxin [Phormidium tenue]|uniref:Addiction module protein n=1 Tax=Phormidium tenue NIES-30 TaxID=549789 RepID=A0A1U7J3M2_9CYAN|nr:type II toxin-antitoxin system RelE/ParE family toxin [Phormidium tenue]MBD2233333.1 type II toxin-antitoxin system RelE/ParE family toxin [Phormidium tenue FACHB-1052]OKH46932.1 addiction module protein [Phormidium tenue NIES-30]
MQSTPREIRLYVSVDGSCPFEAWLDGLRDRQARARIRKRLDRVELGNLGDAKPLGEGVSELRVDYGPGYRIYIAQVGTAIVVLLCGGDKSNQRQDILKAKQYWIDFQQRQDASL